MKYTLLAIFATFVISTANSQPYQSIFGKNSTEWIFHWANLPGVFNDTIRVVKDTAIDNKTYKILEVNDYRIALREDLDSGKVWGRSLKKQYCEDELAFDFSLQVGDTFHSNIYPFNYYPDSARIIDSIKYIDGLKYLYTRTPYYSHNEPITFIESVGSNITTALIFCEFGHAFLKPYLLCSYKDGQQTPFRNPYYNGKCRTLTNVIDVAELSKNITLHPQPAKDKLYIKTENSINITHCIIHNIHGQVVTSQQSKNITQIDIRDLPFGTYCLKMITDNNQSTSKIFIKQ